MSKYINDINDEEFIEMVKELELKPHFFDKLYYSMDKTGIQCLLPENFVNRTIQGLDYFWGFEIKEQYEYNYILNILCNHYNRLMYDGLTTGFLKRTKSSDLVFVPGIIEYEFEEIKNTLLKQDAYFNLGYKLEKGKRKMYTIDDERPTIDIAFSLGSGAAYYLYEVLLKNSLKAALEPYPPKNANDSEVDDVADDPAFSLETQYEKLLYFKYSGLLDGIINSVGNNNRKISKVISQITGDNAESLRGLLGTLISGYNKTTQESKLYKKSYVENTLDALRDTGFDATELSKVYEQIITK